MTNVIDIHNDELLIDFIIINSPNNGSFKVDDILDKIKFSISDRILLLQKKSSIKDIMLNQLGYLEVDKALNLRVTLSAKGREVKNAGGHFSYLKGIEETKSADRNRQNLNDIKLQYDLKNSKRIFKTYWWTFSFSIIALIISLVLLILKVLESHPKLIK